MNDVVARVGVERGAHLQEAEWSKRSNCRGGVATIGGVTR